MDTKYLRSIVTYALGVVVVIALRFLPHPPNVEPIMATTLPFSKCYGPLWGATFSFFAILGYDLLSGTIGSWTWMTALTYALVTGLGGLYLQKQKESGVREYVLFSIVGTLFYDAITGVVFGVLIYDMGLWETVLGQIPFTIAHLLGNVVLAATLSPLIEQIILKGRISFFAPAFKKLLK